MPASPPPSHEALRRVLGNGLTVLAVPDHAAPLVAVNLWYGVGSRDEEAGKTGFAHLFEHLMFQGSANVSGTEHFSLLQEVGASLNGTTSFDRTNYYETVPRHALELALWLEADRMATLPAALTQENLDNQRDVVKNERRQRYDNVPYGTVWERITAASFPAGHPYHHMPIGSMEHLDAASLADTHEFFAEHYLPGNAVLTIAGDVPAEEAFALAEGYFGAIPSAPRPVRRPVMPLGPFESSSRIVVEEDVPLERLYLAWRVPPAPSREHLAIELALGVLTHGSYSRLPARLVRRDESAHSVSGFTLGLTAGTDLAVLVVSVKPGESRSEVEAVLTAELERFASEGPSPLELQRALAQFDRGRLEALSSVESLADDVSQAELLFGDPSYPFTRSAAAASVTAAEVQAAARLLLNERLVLEYALTDKDSL